MTLDRAIRLAQAWADGRVCTLQDGEVQEYHKLALAALRAQAEAEKNDPLPEPPRENWNMLFANLDEVIDNA